MNDKAWTAAARKFRKQRIWPTLLTLREEHDRTSIAFDRAVTTAFNEGFLQGYNASNVMHAKKGKRK